jgi:hypothetical protein
LLFEGQHSPQQVLALFSRVMAEPQPDWPRQALVTGRPMLVMPYAFDQPDNAARLNGSAWRASLDENTTPPGGRRPSWIDC